MTTARKRRLSRAQVGMLQGLADGGHVEWGRTTWQTLQSLERYGLLVFDHRQQCNVVTPLGREVIARYPLHEVARWTARFITADDILDLLPIVAGEGWHEIAGMIRNLQGECPMCAFWREVGGEHGVATEPFAAAYYVGLASESIKDAMWEIARASDFRSNPYRPRLEAALEMRP